MGFLSQLGQAISDKIVPGENTPRSLDTVDPNDPNRTIAYGALGSFANRLDKTAQRSYLEDGFISNVQPRTLEIMMQQPDITVLIKKRMFSSLSQNFRFDLMNDEEKLFIKASKKLFQNKCNIISTYEKLTKIEKIMLDTGILNSYALPQIFSGIDSLEAAGVSIIDAKTKAIFDTIRKVNSFSETNNTTTWLSDKDSTFVSDSGEGTGVIELTMVTSINTTVSTIFGGGSGSLNITDPYKMMIITRDDIDKAITDASNKFNNNNFFTFSDKKLSQLIELDTNDLNQQRLARSASPIRFLLNPSTVISKKVRAIIDGEGREINFVFNSGALGLNNTVEIDPSAFEGKNGLNDTDGDLFRKIIKNIFQLLALRDHTQSQIKQFNAQTNYVRRKMYLHFANKPIIQPLDTINIFISSKSEIDKKSSANLQVNFGTQTLATQLNNTIQKIGANFADLKSLFSGTPNNSIETEKAAIVGADFPTWLWRLLRNDFTKQAAGVHVFAGLVKGATHSYDSGSTSYNLSVDLEDNSGYFSKSQVNINPSVDVYNSPLYDPLTPFKISFDEATGIQEGKLPPLLDENLKLLDSGILKFTGGRFRGSNVDQAGYSNVDYEKSNNTFRRILNDPNGFVYRWKEGIGSLTKFGEPHPADFFDKESSPKLTTNPYAGQDVMNILSLLITGNPYNFNTFMKAAISSGSLNHDELTNEHGSRSFFRGLINDISKNNQVWGNFIPFKKLVVSDSAYSFLASGQASFVAQNAMLNDLLSQRAELFDRLTLIQQQFGKSPKIFDFDANLNPSAVIDIGKTDANISDILLQIGKLDLQIEKTKRNFSTNLDQVNLGVKGAQIKIFGDDISFNDTDIIDNNSNTQEQRTADREELRKKINFLTLRRLWKVKANEDQNLFVVDDSYDKDYDIQAFEKTLGNFDLFTNDYQDVSTQIKTVMELLGLEVFADTQGHIHARAPQYNKVPSSVFFKMFRDKFKTGIQVFPTFLEKLFVNQIQGLSDKLEIVEDQIRLNAAVLGQFTDNDIKTFISGTLSVSSGLSSTGFSFTTDENTGRLGSKDLRVIFQQKNPDINEAVDTKSLDELSKVVGKALKSSRNFDIVRKIENVNNTSFQTNFDDNGVDRILKIRERLKIKTGEPAPTIRDLLSNDRLNTNIRSQVDILKINNSISQYVSERAGILTTLSNAIKNLDQGAKLNNDGEGATTALFPFLSEGQNQIPDILQHMIEDESYDDLGPGSGARYIIKEHQVISLSVVETPPNYTIVEVNGLFGEGLSPPPNDFSTKTGGNFVSSAWAVDYDMWRMYGFRSVQPFSAPFFSDPVSQCAPYAVALLNRARRDIIKASLTIAGNEYIQAGEVIYIEDRDLLFYVEKVNHSLDIGGRFVTSMSLTYGHNPGEYIPTMLDIVGKSLYSNRNLSSDYRSARFDDDANGDISLSTIIFDNRFNTNGNISDLLTGTFGDKNRKNLANILLSITGIFSPNNLNQVPTIDIRIYHNSSFGIPENATLKNLAQEIINWIKNPTQNSLFNTNELLPHTSLNNGISLTDDQVKISSIDLSGDTTHSPSKLAISAARSLGTNDTQFNLSDDLAAFDISGQDAANIGALFSSVFDIWLTFSDPVLTLDTQKSGISVNDQLTQQQIQQLNNLVKGK